MLAQHERRTKPLHAVGQLGRAISVPLARASKRAVSVTPDEPDCLINAVSEHNRPHS